MTNATHQVRTLTCPVCGQGFTVRRRNQRYCGPACRTINNRAETTAKREAARIRIRECPGCGATFEPVGRQRFCSRRCAARIETRRRLGIADPGLIGTCWWCHAKFSLLDGRRFYCSTECARFVRSLWSLAIRYGITRDDYRAAWYRQDGKCAICRRPERTVRNHLLSIDHDHVTGRFRALLCSHCNRGIGLFQDDPAILLAAARYVTTTRSLDG